MRIGRGVMVVGLMLGHGCQSDSEFQCQTHEQCVSNGVTGICQPTGYCSFADGACPSGFRYGDSAAPGLAGQCVEPSAETTGGTDPGPVTTGVSAASISASSGISSSSSGEPDDSSESSSGTSTDATSSTGTSVGSSSAGTSGSSSSSGGDSSSSGGVTCPTLVEEFDNGIVDEAPWTLEQSVPPIAFEAGETLRYSITTGLNAFASVSLQAVDIASGYAVAHLVALPQDESAAFVLAVQEGGAATPLVELMVTGQAQVSARAAGEFVAEAGFPSIPDDLWLEIYFDAGVATFAYSVDGDAFETLASVPVDADLSDVDIALRGGASAVTTQPLHIIEVDDFEYCPDPFPNAPG